MQIQRYLQKKNKNKSNLAYYSLIEREMGCADGFTRYKSNDSEYNYNTLELTHIKCIFKELPDLYFILSKLKVKIKDNKIIDNNKAKLVFCFRLIRHYYIKNNRLFIDTLIDILSNTHIRIFQAILLAEIIQDLKKNGNLTRRIYSIHSSSLLHIFKTHYTRSKKSFSQYVKTNYVGRSRNYHELKIENHKDYLDFFLNKNYYYTNGCQNHNKKIKDYLYVLNNNQKILNLKQLLELRLLYNKLIKMLKEDKVQYKKALTLYKDIAKKVKEI